MFQTLNYITQVYKPLGHAIQISLFKVSLVELLK